jgi:hypothetical protein
MEFSHKLIVGNTGEQAWGDQGESDVGKIEPHQGTDEKKDAAGKEKGMKPRPTA